MRSSGFPEYRPARRILTHAPSAPVVFFCLLGVLSLPLVWGGFGCGTELTPVSSIVRLRILAIQADPPEAQPGESVRLSALVVDPFWESRGMDWTFVLCTPDEDSGECFEYSALETHYSNPDVLQDEYASCCLRGGNVNPADPVLDLGDTLFTTVQISPEMLDGLSDEAAEEGINAQVNVVVCESGVCAESLSEPGADASSSELSLRLPADQSAFGIKRIRVSSRDEDHRNHNPVLKGIVIDGAVYDEGYGFQAFRGATYVLHPLLEDGSVETYDDPDAPGTEKTEQPYFAWYGLDGAFSAYYSEPGVDDADVMWTAPTDEAIGDTYLFAVVWDRRGGIDWVSVPVRLF